MAKRKDRDANVALYERLWQQVGGAAATAVSPFTVSPSSSLTQLKKFRFQLLHLEMVRQLAPCRVADIGGGKGLLAYLLQQSGWQATVIDPVAQALPEKYRDWSSGRQVKIGADEQVPRVARPFHPEMAAAYDLLVGVHAHGCNVMILEAAAHYHCRAILLPCCIIDEPLLPPPGQHWLSTLVGYARGLGLWVNPFWLNFKGQNIGLFVSSESPGDFSTWTQTEPELHEQSIGG